MNWTEFSRKIRINASIDTIYQSWTETKEVTTWFLNSANIVEGSTDGIYRKGDKAEWTWNNNDMIQPIDIIEANGKDRLAFTFGHGMEVYIQITSDDQYSILALQQIKIPTDEPSKFNYYAGCIRGWTFWMVNLKAYLEHHILLHDVTLGKRPDLFDFCNT